MKKAHKHLKSEDSLAKQRLDEKEVESGLRAIYGDEEDVDFTRLERRTWTLSGFLVKLVITLGSLSVLVWAGYFAYIHLAPKSDTTDLQTVIRVQDMARSGERGEIVFEYANPKRAPLANLSVRAQLPDGFIVDSATPEITSEEGIMWNLGALESEEKGSIAISGNWITTIPSKQPIQFISTYRPSNFNAEFTHVESAQVAIEESIAELTITGPESLSAGEVGSFAVALRNTGTDPLPPTELELLLPQGFFLEELTPAFTTETAPVWAINELPGGGETQFSFNGSFASGEGGFTPFTTTLNFLHEDRRLVQATKTHTVDVAAGDITFDLSLNGKVGSVSAAPGDTITASIIIENTTNTRITNASILMDFRAEGRMPIRWGGFDYDGGRLTADGVLWEPSVIGDLEPGEKLILSPSFPITGALTATDAKRLDIILHLQRGAGDLKSEVYSVYIGEEASISATLESTDNPSEQKLHIIFSPPPQPLEDILITLQLDKDMTLFETLPLSIGNAALVNSTKEWKWRIPTLGANSTPITADLILGNIPENWDERVFLRAIDPVTLEEINTSITIQ